VLSAFGALVLVAGVAIGSSLPGPSIHPAHADADTAGTAGGDAGASGATTLFSEDFEANDAASAVSLSDYGSTGHDYTAGVDPQWLDTSKCNGIVLGGAATSLPDESAEPDEDEPGCAAAQNLPWMTPLVTKLAELHGVTSNSALVSVTRGGTSTPGGVIFDSGSISASAGTRYLRVSADAADAQGCKNSPPRYVFSLIVGTSTTPLNADDPLTACAGENASGATGAVASRLIPGVARFWSGETGTFSLRISNETGTASGDGDDGAIDNIRVEDVTPTVSQRFAESSVKAGDTAKIVVTVHNTQNSLGGYDAKSDWGFADRVPVGLQVSTANAIESSCGDAMATVDDDETVSITGGDLGAGETSCTVTIPVQQASGYDEGAATSYYSLDADALTLLVGLDRIDGGTGAEQTITYTDAKPPLVPNLQPSAGTTVSGTTEAGATVTVATVCDGDRAHELGRDQADAAGAFEVRLTSKQPDGTALLVRAADAEGNASACTALTVLAAPPPAPDVSDVADGVATGTAEPGTTVVVTDAKGHALAQAPADGTGRFRLRVAAPVGSEVTLYAQDAAGNRSAPVTAVVAAPNRPVTAYPLAAAAPSVPSLPQALPRTGLGEAGWPAAIALMMLTGVALVVLARAGGRWRRE
jgi:hypothetical protein